jgi:elongation factor G
VPKIAFINKMDRIGADFFRAVQMIKDRLGATPLILQLPWGSEDTFRGVIDLLKMKAITWEDESLGAQLQEVPLPSDLMEEASSYRDQLLETLADRDDAIMTKYLGEEEIEPQDLKRAIRNLTLKLQAVPVLCGAALRNKGIQPLLDSVVDFLPSPAEVPSIIGHDPVSGLEITRPSTTKKPFCALAFKVQMDQGRKLTYMRVYSGSVKTGDSVYNPGRNAKEKLARLLKMHSNKRERIEAASAGDIVGVMGLKLTTTGDTLCTEDHPILLEPISFNQPVITMAVEPKGIQDQDKLMDALAKLADEDPTFTYRIDEETGQTVISGMGELHLDIKVNRLKREFSLDTNRGKPQVVYRETISKAVVHEEIFQKELAGQQHYAGVKIEIKPLPRGSGSLIVDRCENPGLSEEFVNAIKEGLEEAMSTGILMGYPVIDVEAAVLDVKIHETYSDALAFRVAGSMAFRNASGSAGPVLLEPVMKAEILVPEEFMGEVIGDINARQGKIEQITSKGPVQVLTASVPLSKMFGYSTALRSVSQGRGTFTMQFSHYDKV